MTIHLKIRTISIPWKRKLGESHIPLIKRKNRCDMFPFNCNSYYGQKNETAKWIYCERGVYVPSDLSCVFGFQYLLGLYWRMACRCDNLHIVFRDSSIVLCRQIYPIRTQLPKIDAAGIEIKDFQWFLSLKISHIRKYWYNYPLREKREWKSCLQRVKGLEKAWGSNERFN